MRQSPDVQLQSLCMFYSAALSASHHLRAAKPPETKEIAGGPTVEAQVVVASRLKEGDTNWVQDIEETRRFWVQDTKIFSPGNVTCNSTLWLFWIVLSPSLLMWNYFTEWIWPILLGEFPLHVSADHLRKYTSWSHRHIQNMNEWGI